MFKLLEAYKANPTEANKIKVLKYNSKHMMATCMLSLEDQKLVKQLSQ